jgi:hypothetical protein
VSGTAEHLTVVAAHFSRGTGDQQVRDFSRTERHLNLHVRFDGEP